MTGTVIRGVLALVLVFVVISGARAYANLASVPSIELEKRWEGINGPVAITFADDDSGRLFIVERWGRIRVVKDGNLLTEPFLDIKDRVTTEDLEQGLLGLAFPPGYAEKQYFYVDYIDKNGDTIIARYHADGSDPNRALHDSEEVILKIEQPGPNHNGGTLAFGPNDGYLYISSSEGELSIAPLGNAQDPNSLLGKILRIDVEGSEAPYGIPANNPFLNTPDARGEVWSLGFRNPWRFSFDALTGDLFIGDVGQFKWEELDFQPAASAGGENYGWPVLEGNHCYIGSTCSANGMTPPIFEYPHTEKQCAIIGGEVYRGEKLAALTGLYIFGDTCTGRIWASRREAEDWSTDLLLDSDALITTFGRNAAGDIFVADLMTSAVYEIVSVPSQMLYMPLLTQPQ
ncbi:MAG: PQQ-dependent sugar dehydrogenase [Caldilineales bacterium]|nr:PQQ-dependent sugar dehydrogenase [Caldilineales bacterium]